MPRSTFPLFPTDDGWPYPDLPGGSDDPAADDEIDLDVLELRADRHAFAALSPAEYQVLCRRFGLTGSPTSMKDLSHELGCTHAETRELLGSAIEKLRTRLTADPR
jgi:DNA-directed RNA polymerase sigma subunit (sigma70/sigma32)